MCIYIYIYIVKGIESDNSKHLEKVSFCQLEADAIADDILNVSQVSGNSLLFCQCSLELQLKLFNLNIT